MILAACLLAALTFSGCGLGPGKSEGTAELLVTQNYGTGEVASKEINGLTESTTVMRALDDSAEIETKYGGGFVSSIDGITNAINDGRSIDWFYFVNGVAGDRGAAEYEVSPDDRIWWDYRDWTSAMEAQAVIGSFPAPLVGGFDGEDPGVSVECLGGGATCDAVSSRLTELGAKVGPGVDEHKIKVIVGPWSEVSKDPDAKRLGDGPQSSGVFAGFKDATGGADLLGLNDEGDVVNNFGSEAGLIAATRRGNNMPVWVITAGSVEGLPATVDALKPEVLDRHYAAVVFDNRIASLPLP